MNINNPFETYTRGMTARERRIRSKWALMFAITGLIAIVLTFKVKSQNEDIEELNVQIETLTEERDKLHDDNFVNGVELTRWETTMEWYEDENPQEFKKIEGWRSHNTE